MPVTSAVMLGNPSGVLSAPRCKSAVVRLLQPRSSQAQRLVTCPGATAAPVAVHRGQLLSKSSVACNATGDNHAGRAFLHDFCMTIPYGAISVAAGLVLFFMPGPVRETGIAALAGGLAICVLSVLSLKQWKQGQESAPFTLMSAGAAAAIGYNAWAKLQAKAVSGMVSMVAAWGLVGLSSALALFCIYNVAAGGNPPKKLA